MLKGAKSDLTSSTAVLTVPTICSDSFQKDSCSNIFVAMCNELLRLGSVTVALTIDCNASNKSVDSLFWSARSSVISSIRVIALCTPLSNVVKLAELVSASLSMTPISSFSSKLVAERYRPNSWKSFLSFRSPLLNFLPEN